VRNASNFLDLKCFKSVYKKKAASTVSIKIHKAQRRDFRPFEDKLVFSKQLSLLLDRNIRRNDK
jgi:hypothetical protein